MSEQPVQQQPQQPSESTEKAPPVTGASRQPSFGRAAASAAAAMFGVQSSKNRHEDFKAASPARFIFMGAVMVCVFVTCVLIAVRCSMQQAGLAGP